MMPVILLFPVARAGVEHTVSRRNKDIQTPICTHINTHVHTVGVEAYVMTTETGCHDLTRHSISSYILSSYILHHIYFHHIFCNKAVIDKSSTLPACDCVHLNTSSVSKPDTLVLGSTSVCRCASGSPRSPCSRTYWRSFLGSSSSASSGRTGISPGSPASFCAPSDTS